MNKKNTISLILLVAMLASLAACGTSEVSQDTGDTSAAVVDTTASNADIPEEINRENAKLRLPEIDFGGETFNLLYVGEDVYRQDIYAEETGDVVDDAVFARNRAIEELLNCKLNPICFSDDTKTTANHIGTVVKAQEDLYDLCSTHQAYTAMLVTNGYFHNFADDTYIDWEMPWWNTEYMNEMVVGNDTIFFLLGDISLMRMKSLGSVYYNREMYEELYGDADGMYDIVFDGKWTFDRFAKMCTDAYIDLNGNTVSDEGDRFGAFGNKTKSVEHYQYACGITSTTKNADGIPELTLNNEKTVDYVNKFYSLYYENPGFRIDTDGTFNRQIGDFKSGYYLFCPVWFRHADSLREMETDYGIVNFPKYAEDEEYRALVHDGTTLFVTPVTSKKTDKIGAVCEAMGYYNYISVTPAYFEVALKVKYSRDDKTSKVLDIISESAYTNFGYVYATQIANLGYLRSLASEGTNDFSSWYAKMEPSGQKGLQKLIDTYLAME
ncbi:MAG: hypothetical protein E7632_08290 [Ruminococcaceae bacterium]|nr:hypothetical protein [Oscillospiraceae bacterium]